MLSHLLLASFSVMAPGGTGEEGTLALPAAPAAALPRWAEASESDWVFSFTPYMWLYGMDGDLRVRNTSADFDVGFDDLLDNLDIALMGHFEAWKGRLGFYVDPSYGRLMVEGDSGVNDVDVETDMVLVDFGALYRVLDKRTPEGRARSADVSLGGRYMYLKNEIDFAVLQDRSESGDFIDLTVGGRYAMDVTERIGLLVGGDIGGFDFGSSSEFAWNLQGLGSYRVGKSGRIWGGYRILDIDRDDGGSSGIDFAFSGPIIGYEFRF